MVFFTQAKHEAEFELDLLTMRKGLDSFRSLLRSQQVRFRQNTAYSTANIGDWIGQRVDILLV